MRNLTLLARVVGRLAERGIPCALIGAEALALRGVSRATADRDLLATDLAALDDALWRELGETGVRVEVRRGDPDDPLAGVVRFDADEDRPVDLIIGRHAWQTRILQRSPLVDLEDVAIAVPSAADLVLLKLYAAGPQDAWDVAQLLNADDRETLIREVAARLGELPADCRDLWEKLLPG
ncbi:MAG: hypothetical protein ABI639_01315 [Thermoanaerobaculia bacterium]